MVSENQDQFSAYLSLVVPLPFCTKHNLLILFLSGVYHPHVFFMPRASQEMYLQEIT